MSYSVCFSCGHMVPCYEKYCERCALTHKQENAGRVIPHTLDMKHIMEDG